jgi:hypothetical protein
MVLKLERYPATAEIHLGDVEVLAVHTEGDMPQPHGALVVASRPEQRESAPFRHQSDRRVTPRGSVLAPEAEDIPVPALGGLLIADGQRDVIQALHTKSHFCPLRPVLRVRDTCVVPEALDRRAGAGSGDGVALAFVERYRIA